MLSKEIRPLVLSHIRENARNKEILIIALNGVQNHLHCLLSLNAEMTIAKALQLLKGESAHWINEQQLLRRHFEWADEYFAISVSESGVEEVKRYIERQEEHHRKRSWEEEVEGIGPGAKVMIEG